MRAYKFGQKWEIGQKSPALTGLRKTDAANPIKPFKSSRNQRFRKFWSLLLRMPEAGSFAIRVALAVSNDSWLPTPRFHLTRCYITS